MIYKGKALEYHLILVVYEKCAKTLKCCCPQCGSEYVGSTARTLGCRISEHKGVSYRTGARLSQPSHSAVRAHSEQCDVRIRDEHFKILDTFPSSNIVLRILESLHIFHKQPKLMICPVLSLYISSIDANFFFLFAYFSFK